MGILETAPPLDQRQTRRICSASTTVGAISSYYLFSLLHAPPFGRGN